MKKIVAKSPAFKMHKKKSMNDIVRYLLIGALILLVAFTLVYVYNIHTMSSKLEKFTQSGNPVSKPRLEIVFLRMNGCGHCSEFAVTFQGVKQHLIADPNINSKFTLDLKEIEQSEEGAAKYMNGTNVTGFPTLLVYIDDKYIRKIVGNNNEASVMEFINDVARTQ